MTKRLVEVGLSVMHGTGDEKTFDKVATELVSQVLRPVNIEQLRVSCAFLLATADWCGFPTSISEYIGCRFRQRLGYEVPLIGASMAGFYCSTVPRPFIRQGVMLLALCSNDLWVTVGHMPAPYASTGQERKRKLKEMADDLIGRAGTKLGASADKSLFGFLPGVLSDEQGNRTYLDNELHEEILEAFNYGYQLVGASAADSIEPKMGYQFANKECMQSGLVLAHVESDLSTATMMSHGFVPHESARVSVDAIAGGHKSGYLIEQLDGRPARQRVQELKSDGNGKLDSPVFGLPCGSDFHVIWPHETPDKAGDSIWFKRRVALGDRLYVLEGLPQQMLTAATGALSGALTRTNASVGDLSLIIGFSCAGRLRHYATRQAKWMEVVNQIREDYHGVPLVWALSAGEFGVDDRRRARANNMSISVTCVSNNYSRRARIRNLQDKLLNAASSLAACESPGEVMEVAMKGAEAAGGMGGQIAWVDNRLHRIINKEFGYAAQPRHSPQDWLTVGQMTDRAAPRRIGGHLPLYLKEYALPVHPDVVAQLEFSSTPPSPHDDDREDILTIAVRTLHAIYVPDSLDPKFHCNRDAVAAGHLGCQIVIPLVGSQNRAIATLQIGLPDKFQLDRESLVAWVGYAQKVGMALERTQEAVERAILSSLSNTAGEIMQAPADPLTSPYDWCEKYLQTVVELLKPDGAHMRFLLPNSGVGNKHVLGATVGLLKDLLPKTRRVIGEGDGSFNRKLLVERNGWVSNLKRETSEHLKTVKAVEQADQYGAALERELHKIEAIAFLPIYDQDFVVGTLDIYSKRQYFFTERHERIARAAAMHAGDLLRARTAEYERARAEKEKNWILRGLIALTEGVAKQRLKTLLEHLCEGVKADIGSLYIWEKEAKKLILHTSFGWYEQMDGRAAYEVNEGWTGQTAFGRKDIVIVHSAAHSVKVKRYYKSMFPPEHRSEHETEHPRVGIRLTAGRELVGFIMLSYYPENAKHLVRNEENILNYLKAVRNWITLAVEAANQESRQQQMERLLDVKSEVANLLIQTSVSEQSWPRAMEAIRKGFMVERVTFYEVCADPDKYVQLGWSAQADERAPAEPAEPIEPFDALADIVLRQQEVMIASSDDPRLDRWPNHEGVESLFAIPVISPKGKVYGILEFVNRAPTINHPFHFFDNMERSMASEVSTPIAAALEQREHDRVLAEMSSQLATAQRIGASGLFSAIVMHHVMSPFSRMRIAIDWLREHPDCSTEERDSRLNSIEAAYAQAKDTINQAARRGAPEIQRISLRKLVQQTLRVMAPELPVPGIRQQLANDLTVSVSIDLWPVVGALVNLVSNALDAMKGSGVLTIATELTDGGRTAAIRIHNTGPALDAERIKQLFRAGFTTKGSDHIGLGLSLAKQAIEDAGGQLQMHSPAQGGMEAVVTLPVAAD